MTFGGQMHWGRRARFSAGHPGVLGTRADRGQSHRLVYAHSCHFSRVYSVTMGDTGARLVSTMVRRGQGRRH